MSEQKKKIELQKAMVDSLEWSCCLNCLDWKNGCLKANGAMPPPKVILHGCESWEVDIPF